LATITGLTKDRMITMENATVIDGDVVGDDLILKTRGGSNINAGNVRGPVGAAGPTFIVCTSTTRPTFTGVDEGKAIYETDTDLVRIWSGTRWAIQGRIICTSATRPINLVAADEGAQLYETDTDLTRTWTGTRWKLQERVICTSATRPTSLVAADEGTKIYETDTDIEYIWSGSTWLIVAGNDVSRCCFQLGLGTTQTFTADATFERVRFDVKMDDPAGITTTGTQAGITCPRAGWMHLNAAITVGVAAAVTSHNALAAIFSGSPGVENSRMGGSSGGAIPAGTSFAINGSNIFKVAQGQTFDVRGWLAAVGSGKTILGAGYLTYFSGYYL
jgi:hypothetical protein